MLRRSRSALSQAGACDHRSPLCIAAIQSKSSGSSSSVTVKSPDCFLAFCFSDRTRSSEYELDCVVPAQVAVLIEDCANPFLQGSRNLDLGRGLVELTRRFLELFAQSLAAVKAT